MNQRSSTRVRRVRRVWLVHIAWPFAISAGPWLGLGCSREHAPEAAGATPSAPAPSPRASPAAVAAEVGKPAPDFTLDDVDGRPVHFAEARAGKVAVLEWFNPQCPFVNRSHMKGSLRTTPAKRIAEGVVWLGVDSSAPGKEGYDPGGIREAERRFGVSYPVLRDETGAVGHVYGATNTPHMFVIDKNGTLVYAGAIDNSPDAEGESPTSGSLVNYVDAALDDLAAGRPVKTPRTKAYGCSVKYGS